MALLRRWRAENWWHCSAHLRMRQHSWPSPETSHELWDFPAIRTRGTGKTSTPHQLPQLEYFTTAPPTAPQRLGMDFTRDLADYLKQDIHRGSISGYELGDRCLPPPPPGVGPDR